MVKVFKEKASVKHNQIVLDLMDIYDIIKMKKMSVFGMEM